MANVFGDMFRNFGLAMQGKDPKEQAKKIERMQSLLDSEKGMRLLRRSQAAMNQARAEYYKRDRDVDPSVEYFRNKASLSRSRDYLLDEDEKLPKETEAFYETANRRLDDAYIKATTPRDYFAPGDETDVFEALGKKKGYKEAPTEWLRSGEVPSMKQEKEGKILADYFQTPTETVPEGNVPKTFPQMGITNIDDQATLEEMQKALPDVDIREEYEADSEGMQKLIELWRQGKLNKQNIHKAFSMIQQTAQQSLGLG